MSVHEGMEEGFRYLRARCGLRENHERGGREAWRWLTEQFAPDLPPKPSLSCGGTDDSGSRSLLWVWEVGERHLELEWLDDDEPYFWHYNRSTMAQWNENYDPTGALPEKVRTFLLAVKTGREDSDG